MKKLLLLSILLIIGCSTWNKILPKPNTTIHTGQIRQGMTTEDVSNIMGEPILADSYNSIDEWHYCKTGRLKDAYVILFFIDNKLISKQQLLGNMFIDDIKNISRFGNCANFIKKQDYKIPSEVQEILDKNTPTSPELKEPKEPIEPEEGVMPIIPKVEIPNQPKPPKTEEDE